MTARATSKAVSRSPASARRTRAAHDRDVTAGYVDVTIEPLEKLRLDLAGRYEDYSDFGDTTRGQADRRATRSTTTFALRGTVSTGFRAPTLAEEFYSATNVGPTTAFVQMPPNAPATALLGLGAGLQPEKSTNYSVGFVFRPEQALALTFDVYQVEVRNRIAATSTFYGTIDGELFSQAIVDAIIANGNVLDPEVTASGDTGINLFTNGVTTEHARRRADVRLRSDFGSVERRLDRGGDLQQDRSDLGARHAGRTRHAAAVRPGGAVGSARIRRRSTW